MPSHNPSECPRCRWAAERLKATKLWDGEITRWIKNGQIIRSFCPSLDAVAGLWAELEEAAGPDEWWALQFVRGEFYVFCKMHCVEATSEHHVRLPDYQSSKDLPAQCVIEAAMAVLGEKESDG